VLGYKAKVFKTHTEVSLEDLVPQDNFYRHVEAVLDLSFVRDLVRDSYSPSMGRPSIDPVVFFKLQLIMFFEGIRSVRQLLETVSLNLAHRWYIGYDLDETVPDHSSMSKIRDRLGLETFERFFEHIVELCIEAGLVSGEELYFDTVRRVVAWVIVPNALRVEEIPVRSSDLPIRGNPVGQQHVGKGANWEAVCQSVSSKTWMIGEKAGLPEVQWRV
jgi:transposase